MAEALDAPDPFADPAFTTRVQKLLAMLASEQPGEADAARRKLMEHLASHRLSLTDLAQRFGAGGSRNGSGQGSSASGASFTNGASFTGGAREISLERQLGIAREARQEAEREVAQLRMLLDDMQQSLQRATNDIGTALHSRGQMRQRASIAWGVAAICLVVAAGPRLAAQLRGQHGQDISTGPVLLRAPKTQDNTAILRTRPGERFGTVLVQDAAVRLTPFDNAGVRSFLNLGMRVVVEEEVRVGVQSWLRIRSVSGSGWVRASDILH